jgi:hypothetical protein
MSVAAHTAIEGQVRLYGKQAGEQLQRAHEDAMACRDLEDVLAFGSFLFDHLVKLDEAWRGEVFSRLRPFVADEAKTMRVQFEQWHQACTNLEPAVRQFETRGFDVTGATEFRRNCAEVAWMLAPAAEALGHEKLARLGDEAIAEHRRGETVPAE